MDYINYMTQIINKNYKMTLVIHYRAEQRFGTKRWVIDIGLQNFVTFVRSKRFMHNICFIFLSSRINNQQSNIYVYLTYLHNQITKTQTRSEIDPQKNR